MENGKIFHIGEILTLYYCGVDMTDGRPNRINHIDFGAYLLEMTPQEFQALHGNNRWKKSWTALEEQCPWLKTIIFPEEIVGAWPTIERAIARDALAAQAGTRFGVYHTLYPRSIWKDIDRNTAPAQAASRHSNFQTPSP